MSGTAPKGSNAASSLPDRATMLTLDDAGTIQECGGSCEEMFGYAQSELKGRHVSVLLPQLEGMALVQNNQANPRLSHLCRCGAAFRARRRDNESFATELFINRLEGGRAGVLMIVRDAKDQD